MLISIFHRETPGDEVGEKRGPQRRYDNDGKGAPGIFVRLEAELHDWVKSQETEPAGISSA